MVDGDPRAAHMFTFNVWKESIKIRYIINCVLFIALGVLQ